MNTRERQSKGVALRTEPVSPGVPSAHFFKVDASRMMNEQHGPMRPREAKVRLRELWQQLTSPFRGLTLKEVWYGVILYAPENLRDLWVHQVDRFDQKYGTDTTRAVAAADLKPSSDELGGAIMYWPARRAQVEAVVRAANVPVEQMTFVDIGSGKGRVLMVAAELGFRRVLGVEFSPSLCDIARNNIAKFQNVHGSSPDIAVECVDAATWIPPKEPLFIFMFDPFGEAVVARVAENLAKSLAESPRPCIVVYVLPTQRKQFDRVGFRVTMEQGRTLRLSYPWCIYELPRPTAGS